MKIDTDEIYLKQGSDTLILFVHGFTARPQVFSSMVDYLKPLRFDMRAIRLANHGGGYARFCRGNLKKWRVSVSVALKEAKAAYRHIYLVGHSLGGQLCLDAATHDESVERVVTIGAPLVLTTKEEKTVAYGHFEDCKAFWDMKLYSWGLTHDRPKKNPLYIDLVGLGVLKAAKQLKLTLDRVTVPVLNIHSKLDETAGFASQQMFEEKLINAKLKIITLEESGHTYLVPAERSLVYKEIADFLSSEEKNSNEKD